MAYAAVVSLMQILENITLHPHPCEKYLIPWEKQQIESLHESMRCFHDFLTRSWRKRSRVARCLEGKIRDAAYKAEDVIESYISEHFSAENGGEKLGSSEIVSQHLQVVVEQFESIKLKMTRLEDLWADAIDMHHTHYSPLAQTSKLASSGDYTKEIFEDVSLQLMDRITGGRSKVIPVVGMGGSGKTTLVRNAFQHGYISHLFDVAAWVTVSQNYRERDILLGLLESMRRLTDEMHQESDAELSECLYKCLKGKRYLIVMDDMWHKEAWENIKRLFPDDDVGSRVLLTTRLSDVAAFANSSCNEHLHMRLLNEKESWDLLCSKVFGGCPTELEEVGKKIARSCKGLPLSIVVLSGLLSKVPRFREEWESIARNLNSFLIANDRQCTQVLSLSYDHLPHHLKACFLYTGVFPVDMEIPISKLIKLWIAEGFIKPNSSKSLEEVGEEYFDDLISRNLILVGEKKFDGTIKTCVVHDLLREWCLSKAREEKFIHTLNANIYNRQEVAKDPRRLCIRKDSLGADIFRTIGPFSLVRSVLSQINPRDKLWCCKLLRVLDLSEEDLEDFPHIILELVHLKYAYVCCKREQEIHISEDLPDSLRNLQTFIIHQRCINSSVHLPRGIWRMPHLRHLQLGKCYFPLPQEGDKNSVLEDLQTLSYVSSSSCSEDFIKRIPNVKELGIRVKTRDDKKAFSFIHLVNLHKLEILKCIVEPRSNVTVSKDLTLPQNLKKLTLNGTRISWKDMSIVDSLPKLEVLKLKNDAFQGPEWKPTKDGFCQLKCLLIEGTDLQHWRANKDHFPRLQRLILWECTKLKEIPLDFVNLGTLQSIELDDASPSAVASARKIQEEGTEGLKVCIYNMWEYIYQKRKEKEEKQRKEADDRWREESDRREIRWLEYERKREAAVKRMREEEEDRRRDAKDRWRKEEETYRRNEDQWKKYQRKKQEEIKRRRQKVAAGRPGAEDRWRNVVEEYRQTAIQWRDYQRRSEAARERMRKEEEDRKREFVDRQRREEEYYQRNVYIWRKFHFVLESVDDDDDYSYYQDDILRRRRKEEEGRRPEAEAEEQEFPWSEYLRSRFHDDKDNCDDFQWQDFQGRSFHGSTSHDDGIPTYDDGHDQYVRGMRAGYDSVDRRDSSAIIEGCGNSNSDEEDPYYKMQKKLAKKLATEVGGWAWNYGCNIFKHFWRK